MFEMILSGRQRSVCATDTCGFMRSFGQDMGDWVTIWSMNVERTLCRQPHLMLPLPQRQAVVGF